MKKITSKKLLKYGAMSAALIGTAGASGQIVFTDIDDTNVFDNGGLLVDLNADGVIDFAPAAGSTVAVVYTGDGTATGSNAFVGFSAGPYNYNSLLAAGDIIDGTSPATPDGARGDLNFNGCAYSNSQFCGGITDGYTGLIFRLAGNTHYGWMRLDLDADGSNFIVKSYAFESTPDTPIAAGDEGVLGIEDQAFNDFSFSTSNGVLTLNATSPLENVSIYNIAGQEVLNRALSASTESVDLSGQATGVYIARVTIDGAEKSFKVIR